MCLKILPKLCSEGTIVFVLSFSLYQIKCPMPVKAETPCIRLFSSGVVCQNSALHFWESAECRFGGALIALPKKYEWVRLVTQKRRKCDLLWSKLCIPASLQTLWLACCDSGGNIPHLARSVLKRLKTCPVWALFVWILFPKGDSLGNQMSY